MKWWSFQATAAGKEYVVVGVLQWVTKPWTYLAKIPLMHINVLVGHGGWPRKSHLQVDLYNEISCWGIAHHRCLNGWDRGIILVWDHHIKDEERITRNWKHNISEADNKDQRTRDIWKGGKKNKFQIFLAQKISDDNIEGWKQFKNSCVDRIPTK